MFEGPISNNKENVNFATPQARLWQNFFFLNFFDVYGNFSI